MTNLTGPGYTVNDLVYWVGLIAGTAGTYLFLQPYELHRIVLLLVSLGVGVVLGMGCEYLFRRSKRTPPPPGDESRPL